MGGGVRNDGLNIVEWFEIVHEPSATNNCNDSNGYSLHIDFVLFDDLRLTSTVPPFSGS